MLLVIWLLLVVSLSFPFCKKGGFQKNGGIDGGNGKPAITPVATATGTPVSKSIGSAGGTLVSADGKLLLTVLAGALTANTNITIQPVTSTMPGEGALGQYQTIFVVPIE